METIRSVLSAGRITHTRPAAKSPPPFDELALILERNGFSKDVAGEDFHVAVRAVSDSMSKGMGILMTGACGCGKTHLMRILYGLTAGKKYWYDCPSNAAHLLNPRDRLIDWEETPFIDDLGTEVQVEYGRRVDTVSEFIRAFHKEGFSKRGKRMFITTNLSSKELVSLYDERIVDRMLDMCVVLKFGGSSHRSREVVS